MPSHKLQLRVNPARYAPIATAVALLLGVGTTTVPQAHAQVSNAVSFSLPQTQANGTFVNGLDGFDFTVSAPVTVTGLGWYDQGGDGLLHDHPVGIFVTATQTLAGATATVTTSNPLDADNFRFASVTPFTLSAGITYTLTGYGAGPTFDPYVNSPNGGLFFGPSINFLNARSGASSGFGFPTTASESGIMQDFYIGPNFRFTSSSSSSSASAPEPAALFLLVPGALGMIAARRRQCQAPDTGSAERQP